ncbi:MAG: type II secretion system minor pseudopilin GspJ [Pontibacterium sp.]
MNSSAQQGLTMIELIVAVALLALIGLATATTLNSAITNERYLDERAEQLEALSYSLSLLRQDLEQAINRSSAAEGYAGDNQPALVGYQTADDTNGELLKFTRTGRRHPPGTFQGSRLQRIRYRITDEQLIRESSPVPDPTETEFPVQQTLFRGISQVQLSYFNGEWQDAWGIDEVQSGLPRAVRITLTTGLWGEVEQVMLLTGTVNDTP